MAMEPDKLEGLLIDYIDGRLSAKEREEVDQEMAHNPEARLLYEQLREVLNAIKQSLTEAPSINPLVAQSNSWIASLNHSSCDWCMMMNKSSSSDWVRVTWEDSSLFSWR